MEGMSTMASDSYYTHLARQQLERLEANRAQCLADLQAAKANSDYDSAGAAVQELADIEAKKQNVLNLHQQYVASQTPPEPVELTPEERHAKPWDRMDWHDALEIARTSKYASDLDANDPLVQAGFKEVLARRARGE
jgi:hypothetical protein